MSNRSTKPNKKVVRTGKKRKIDKASLIILITIIVLGIPALIVGYELISAQLGTHSPVNGSRFDGDLTPEISKDQLKTIENNISNITGVDSASIELATSTLRVYLDCEDSLDDAGIESAVNDAYSQVTSILDVGSYFTLQDDKKMYDIEIHGYNNIDFAEDNSSNTYIYYILNKSSSMEQPHIQLVSQPLDAELAESLRNGDEAEAEVNSSEGDMTVGGSEEEPVENSENGEEQTQE